MPKFTVVLNRTEYLSQTFEIEAKDKGEAYEIAWDKSGDWECVEAEEYTEHIEEIENAI